MRRPHPAIRAAPAIVCPSATARMILARLTTRCGIACERAHISSSRRSAASNSMTIGVLTPISSSLTESDDYSRNASILLDTLLRGAVLSARVVSHLDARGGADRCHETCAGSHLRSSLRHARARKVEGLTLSDSGNPLRFRECSVGNAAMPMDPDSRRVWGLVAQAASCIATFVMGVAREGRFPPRLPAKYGRILVTGRSAT